jgi:hypothetical protein
MIFFKQIIQYEYSNYKKQFVNWAYDPLRYFVCNFINMYNLFEKELFYIKYKFFIFKNFLFNQNISLIHKELIIDFFGKCQRKYFALIKFKSILIYKHTSSYDNKYDLNYNELTSLKSIHKISIIDNKKIYILSLFDLIRIINNSLSYNVDFFIEPNLIKNPYTNSPFNYSQLYQIYTSINRSNLKMPLLFERYFMSNFNMNNFQINNEYFIREYNIKNFHLFDESRLIQYIYNMISFYNNKHISSYNKISIENIYLISYRELLRVFMPYLKLYINANYSYENMINIQNTTNLLNKLRNFKFNNPYFGRKIKCIQIRKIYYISVLHHKYNKSFCFPFSNFYIPLPSLFNVKTKSFIVSENTNYNTYCTYFPDINDLHNVFYKQPNLNIIDISKFAKTYTFNDEELYIIKNTISNDFQKLLEDKSTLSPTILLDIEVEDGFEDADEYEYEDEDTEDEDTKDEDTEDEDADADADADGEEINNMYDFFSVYDSESESEDEDESK